MYFFITRLLPRSDKAFYRADKHESSIKVGPSQCCIATDAFMTVNIISLVKRKIKVVQVNNNNKYIEPFSLFYVKKCDMLSCLKIKAKQALDKTKKKYIIVLLH